MLLFCVLFSLIDKEIFTDILVQSHCISCLLHNSKLKFLLKLASNDFLITKEEMLGNFLTVKRKVILLVKK